MSPSNLVAELKEKMSRYLEAGAEEGWVVYPDLRIDIFDANGQRPASQYAIDMNRVRDALKA